MKLSISLRQETNMSAPECASHTSHWTKELSTAKLHGWGEYLASSLDWGMNSNSLYISHGVILAFLINTPQDFIVNLRDLLKKIRILSHTCIHFQLQTYSLFGEQIKKLYSPLDLLCLLFFYLFLFSHDHNI